MLTNHNPIRWGLSNRGHYVLLFRLSWSPSTSFAILPRFASGRRSGFHPASCSSFGERWDYICQCDMNDDEFASPPRPTQTPYVPASVIPSGVMTDSKGQNLRPGRSFIWPPLDPNQQPPTWIKVINQGTESCIFKSATSAVVGGGLGLMCGLFFGGYSNAVDKAVEMDGTTGMKLRVGMKEAAKSMGSYARSFAKVGGIYVLAECTLERVRARHDLLNSVVGGCVTGGALSASPKSVMPHRARAIQMAMGCASFAVFSAAIEYYMEYM